MKQMFENCVLIERRNWHKIYEIEKDMQYWIDFCDGWWRTTYSLAEAEQISDEYHELEEELEHESMLDMATEQDLY